MATKPPVILHQTEPCEVLACGGLPEGTGRVRLRRGAGRLGCTRRSCSPLPVQIAQRLVQRDILLATVAGTQATLLLLAPSALRLLLASALRLGVHRRQWRVCLSKRAKHARAQARLALLVRRRQGEQGVE